MKIEAINDASDILIDCQSLWKVFGTIECCRDAVIGTWAVKKEVLQRLQLRGRRVNASLQVRRGEIFCIMGLVGQRQVDTDPFAEQA
jgi:glycine betaine/proline transport system ATP-binding protein